MTRLEPDPLIPRQILFSNPVRAAPRLSPKGLWLAYLGDAGGALNLWVAPREEPGSARQLTRCSRSVLRYFWAFDDRHILYQRDEAGDEQWHVDALDVLTGEVRDLTPYPGVSARIERLSPRFPGRALLALNDRNPAFHDLCEVEIASGELRRIELNPGFLRYFADADQQPRFAVRVRPDGGSEYLQRTAEGAWEPFLEVSLEDMLTTDILGFDPTGDYLYLRDSRGRDTTALTRLRIATGETTVLAEDPRADVSRAMFHPGRETLQAVLVLGARSSWRTFDPDCGRAYADLQALGPGDVSVVSRTSDDAFWIGTLVQADAPTRFYIYDRHQRSAQFLFTNFDAFAGWRLARMHPVTIAARDGLELVSYLQLPAWTDPADSGRPASPLPLVVLVHGGPWGRDVWGFNPSSQWLANRGYATLSVNFRGSAGFGKTFLNAGNREWGGRMQDDLLDAVDWAVREEIADPARVALMGSSYGGYAALTGLSRDSDRFACAVDLCGPPNLVSFLESAPAAWKPTTDLLAARVGDHRTAEGRRFLWERSPLAHMERVRKPLLVVHGARDSRVLRRESDRLVEALRQQGAPVVYLLFPDEGHTILRPVNAQAFAAVAEAFLARFLGGRYERVGTSLADSTAEILVGAEWVGGEP